MTKNPPRQQRRVVTALGAMWVSRGIMTLLTLELPDPGLPHQLVPPLARALAWIVTGVAAVVLAWTRSRRPLTLLMVMPALMAVSFGIDAAMAVIPPNPPGAWEALPQLAWWCCWVALLWALSGVPWPETGMPREPEEATHGPGPAAL